MKASDVIAELKQLSNPSAKAGMERVGISTNNSLGVSIPDLRRLAKRMLTTFTP